jgi:diacylglycerol kinase
MQKENMIQSNPYTVHSRMRSVYFAGMGIWSYLKSGPNALIHALVTILVLVLSVCLRLSKMEAAAILLVTGLVWIAEMFNTCIEKIMDFVSPGVHPEVKFIKDVSAGAVLAASVIAVGTGMLILIPKML